MPQPWVACSSRPPITNTADRIAAVIAAVSSVPRKNSRRVTLIAWENGNVRVSACIPTTPKYQSGACAPPPYIATSPPALRTIAKIASVITTMLTMMISGIQM
ncbi:hypothetical protein [Microbacterium elymi]|uniref:Uncharacterized protein n=1 Tax=Microbacterium elymi TaxID=2909587 RepID=A0ABY5NGW5_9MICO|nr:hypothetical protein [Microbacterium elymi]UUT34374.1 hypothetical protein L2X98_27520 [Microbacterium elymi]